MAELRVKGTGTLKLFESDNTSSVTIASPASLSADRTITLPDASVTLASGTMLATDGSGASLTALNASELGSGTVPAARLSGTGKIGQVVSVQSTTNVNMAVSSYTEISTSLRLSITPSASTSKILYMFSTTIRNVDTSNGAFFDLYVDVAAGGYNSASGGDILKYTSYQMGANTYNNVAWSFYDEPATTSALIYSPYYKGANTSVIGIGDAAYIQTWAMEILA
jgi:hypothetical protein